MLQTELEINDAYDYAKQSLSGGLVLCRDVASKNIEQLQRELDRLKLEVAEYKRKEILWLERWQRIAYNIRQRGVQVHKVDCQVSTAF